MNLRHALAPHAVVPVPGLVWGRYPQRDERAPALPSSWWPAPQGDRRWLADVRAQQSRWASLDAAARDAQRSELRALLARDGWSGELRREALGCAAAAMHGALSRSPFDTQLLAASVLLDDRLAEMATGEGKTCAAALAAAVAALAGVPVHVMTANDYLVARDAAELRPFYEALGLRVGAVLATSSTDARRSAYACDITYATAREVAFDYLRDTLSAPASECAAVQPLLRGLCMTIVDEADSLLIDEATLPLVLSETADDAQQRAACVQALALARALRRGEHFSIDGGSIEWLPAGEQQVEAASATFEGAWRNRRHRHDLVGTALEALHVLERDRHYVVRDGRIELLDAGTGRAAPGRVWSRGLHTLVELKERVAVTPTTVTRAQISFQRLFARYLRLAGMSGTLAECRRELAALYRRDVVAITLRRPSQRRVGPDRLFVDSRRRWQAVVRRIAELHASGRPVLVGTDSVAASQALSALLDAAGIAHRVLNAHHDRDEAAIVAAAGRRGAVTVATNMAGRGTDIVLGAGAADLGGLHVLSCQDNASPRLDRQLIGRAARQGDPGSAEIWRTLDAPRWRSLAALLPRAIGFDGHGALPLPSWLLRAWARRLQHHDEKRLARQRRRLLEQDRQWERQLAF